MPSISTVIITYNEEENIARCLKSVAPFSDEILVVDSHSTDRTIEIARELGARIIQRDWPGYDRQRQFAIDNAQHGWVFSIDADEEVSAELCNEIRTLDFTHDGYEMPRPVWYLNRWIKHGVWYPGYILRLFRKDRARVSDNPVHESILVPGRTTRLRGDLLHYSYRDLEHHLDKMNDFTSISAQEMAVRRKRAAILRIVVYPFLEFFKTYVVKRGFLDGFAGFQVSLLHAYYVFLKWAKLREIAMQPTDVARPNPAPDELPDRPEEAKR
jgi:glycosyltransferase involved in cell wall biosynthesis